MLKFLFVVLNHRLADELSSFDSTFVDDDFVVFAELNFVILDCIVERFVLLVAVFDVVNDLEQIYWDGEDLSASLKDLLIFFDNGFILFLKLLFGLGFCGISFEDLLEFGIRRLFLRFGWRYHLNYDKEKYSFFLFFLKNVKSLI